MGADWERALRLDVIDRWAHLTQAMDRAGNADRAWREHIAQRDALVAVGLAATEAFTARGAEFERARRAADIVLRDCAGLYLQAIEDLINSGVRAMAHEGFGSGREYRVETGNAGSTDTPAVPPLRPLGPVKLEEVVVTRRAELMITDGPFESITATEEQDTGVVVVTIGCQSHPLARWRRVGARLIQHNYGSDSERLVVALSKALDKIEATFRRKA